MQELTKEEIKKILKLIPNNFPVTLEDLEIMFNQKLL